MTGRCFLVLAALATAVATAGAGSPYYVSDRSGGEIYRIQDLNGDGDALDAGEKVLWADGMVDAIDLTTDGRAIFAVDRSAGRIMRYADTNGDGDALDAGEATVWADGLGNPYGITMAAGGAVYCTEYSAAEVRRLSDLNGDGDALDAGETLDFTPPLINTAHGLLLDAGGGFFAGARDADTVYRVRDRNGDGDAFDVIEVLSYADNVFGGVNGPWGMAGYSGGGFLLAEYVGDKVSLVRDLNGDGDALDVGEAVRFADGLDAVGIVSMPDPGTLGYNNITLTEGDGNWNITHDTPFVSYGDGAELGVERLRAAFGEGPTSITTGAGGYDNENGDITLAAPIDYSGAGEAALALTAAGSITIAQPIVCTDPNADRLDLALEADAEGRGAGLVSVQAPVVLGDGAFTATGSDFFSGFGGPIEAGTVNLTCAGGVHVGDLLSAAHHEIYATATYVFPGGEISTGGGTVGGDLTVEPGGRVAVHAGGGLEIASSLPWALQGELELQDASLHGSPVMVSGTVRGRGASYVAADLVCIGAPVLDCPEAGDLLVLDGWLSISDLTTLTKTGEGTLVINGPQDHAPTTVFEILGGTVDLNTAAGGAGTANLSILVDDAVLHFGCNQYLDTLTLQNGALVRFTGANVVVLNHLVMNGIDLGGVTLTPEPATLALLAVGGLLLTRRRAR